MQNKDNFKFCIVVPSHNTASRLKFWVDTVLPDVEKFNMDLIVVDSSDNDEVEKFVNGMANEHFIYQRFDEPLKFPDTLDEKVKWCLQKNCDTYDAIWVIRDRSLPVLDNLYPKILDAYNNKNDFVIIYPHWSDESSYSIKEYTSANELIIREFGEMTSLGSIIFFKEVAKAITSTYPVVEHVSLGLWIPIVLFHYIANRNFKTIKITNHSFNYLPYTEASHWFKNKNVLTLFTKWWPKMVEALPNEYSDNTKRLVFTMKHWTLPIWERNILLYARSCGNFSLLDVLQNFNVLKKMAGKRIISFLLVSIVPSVFVYYYLKKRSKNKLKIISKLVNILLPRM